MSVYIAKVLSYLLYPFSWVILLFTMSFFATLIHKQHLAKWLSLSGLCLLWLISLPITGQWLKHQLESRYPAQAIEQIHVADALLVLGGGVHGSAPPWRLTPDLNDAADRVTYSAQLYHAGKAKVIIVSGGTLSWKGVQQSESSAMKSLLMQLGVPESVIIEESQSQSTYENMVNTSKLLPEAKITSLLMVTSAAHMPRSLATANKVMSDSIVIYPASTDIRVVSIGGDWLDYLPQASGLAQLTEAWHEWIGWLVYRLKGYA